jgi:hypothetical protein
MPGKRKAGEAALKLMDEHLAAATGSSATASASPTSPSMPTPMSPKKAASGSAAPGRGGPYCLWRRQMAQPLMPHATAAWLVDNTALSFEQIAEFCGLHILEVQAIADDTAATKLTGRDPIRAGELTHGGDRQGQADPDYRCASRRSPTRSAAPRARATRRSPSARTSRTASPGSSATIPKSRTARSAS